MTKEETHSFQSCYRTAGRVNTESVTDLELVSIEITGQSTFPTVVSFASNYVDVRNSFSLAATKAEMNC